MIADRQFSQKMKVEEGKMSKDVALMVFQEGVSYLEVWVGLKSSSLSQSDPNIEQAKVLVGGWDNGSIKPLRLLFDDVQLSDLQLSKEKGEHFHYWSSRVIEDENPRLFYPENRRVTDADLEPLRMNLRDKLEGLQDDDLNNLSLLTLLVDKYASFISFGEENVAFSDRLRSTAAVAAALANNSGKSLSLVAGDLSGIQNFIYTISSEGALKSLRARSFYLELLMEEIVWQLLEVLELPRTSVIYAGGGHVYILAGAGVEERITQVRDRFNNWLLDKFEGKLYLALDSVAINKIENRDNFSQVFAQAWQQVPQKLGKQKSCKFANKLSDNFFEPREAYSACKVCRRDDRPLKPLKDQNDPVEACPTCREMFKLGTQLFKTKAILRSTGKFQSDSDKDQELSFDNSSVKYHLVNDLTKVQNSDEPIFLINNWKLDDYRRAHAYPILLANYGQKSDQDESFIDAETMTKKAKEKGAIARVGYLRMDVDKLGQIFAKGLGDNPSLPKRAGLSRLMTYFFKVYLNDLAKNRHLPDQAKSLTEQGKRSNNKNNAGLNLLFIYAGGDDLFVSGAWDEVVEFAFDVYQSFRAYTGYNPDVTLSGGVSFGGPKFPLYQAAKKAGEMEDAAKENNRDSLGLFQKAFKWSEWLGAEKEGVITGILPITKKLHALKLEGRIAQSFVQNLLMTAKMQERAIEERKKQLGKQLENNYTDDIIKEIKGYLHLPKIAYTISRLPQTVRDNHDFKRIARALKISENAPYFQTIAVWIEALNRNRWRGGKD